ncbi:MAG: putative quinol monooxygenase [Acidobacteriaceae bacterium]
MTTQEQKPISFLVRMKFAEEDRAEIQTMLGPLTEASRQEPGCLTYIPHWVQGESSTLVIYEQYRDGEALEAHRASKHFEQYAARGLYQKMRERAVEDLIPVV